MPPSAWLGEIYEQFRRELFVTAWAVLRRSDLAEDAVHSAFARLVRLPGPPADPKLYVFRSVRNAAIDLARGYACGGARSPWPEIGMRAGSAPEIRSAELSGLVAGALERLAAESREVVELHLHAGLTFQEIARMLDEPLPTVTARYYRALEKLGQEIKVRHE